MSEDEPNEKLYTHLSNPHYECYKCGKSYQTEEEVYRCSCGEPLWLTYNYKPLPELEIRSNYMNLWRYQGLLPLKGRAILEEGYTPLHMASAIGEYAQLNNLLIKDETRNPTGTFKDRGSTMGIQKAKLDGYSAVGTVSHGNMAISMSSLSAATGIKCFVLIPHDIPEERISFISTYHPLIIQVEGDYGDLYYESLDLGPEAGVRFTNSDTPFRIEGQKTIAYEICEALDWNTPDAVILPISSGGNFSAVWKGFYELNQLQVTNRIPKLFGVQARACAPIARAFKNGTSEVEKVKPEKTIAYSIANHDPPSGNRALFLARQTGGEILEVSDQEIQKAQSVFSSKGGLYVEPAAAVPLAGIKRLVSNQKVNRDECVVLITTGTGFREKTQAGIGLHKCELSNLQEKVKDFTQRLD